MDIFSLHIFIFALLCTHTVNCSCYDDVDNELGVLILEAPYLNGSCDSDNLYKLSLSAWQVFSDECCIDREVGTNITGRENPPQPLNKALYTLTDNELSYIIGLNLSQHELNEVKKKFLALKEIVESGTQGSLYNNVTLIDMALGKMVYNQLEVENAFNEVQLENNSWLLAVRFAFTYAYSGGILLIVEKVTESRTLKKVCELYFVLAWSIGTSLGRIIFEIKEGFVYGSANIS